MTIVTHPRAEEKNGERDIVLVCVDNRGYEAWLTPGRRYRAIVDPEIERFERVRVRDDEGDEYDYPRSCFSSAGPRTLDTSSGRRLPTFRSRSRE